ncbi:MAG: LysO family transporter [Proteobacteria bacterium]|nr:LysO family transporter [Pseudomonadota bacterium]
MRSTAIFSTSFVLGILIGVFSPLSRSLFKSDLSLYALYLLLFLIGIGIGSNTEAWQTIKRLNIRIVLVPLSVIFGTFAGVGLFSVLLSEINLRESLAIGAGFGYYSLSSILIAQIRGETLGVLALLSNIIREITTLLITPLLSKYFGNLAPIASGGATSMDTTLPIITRFTGKQYAMISVFSGIVLTLAAPFFIVLFLKI